MMYDLSCRYDTRKSFYGKAQVLEQEIGTTGFKEIVLYSYGTMVAKIIDNFVNNTKKYIYYGKYSQTTTRHQKEFFRQHNLSDSEIKELFKNGELIEEL